MQPHGAFSLPDNSVATQVLTVNTGQFVFKNEFLRQRSALSFGIKAARSGRAPESVCNLHAFKAWKARPPCQASAAWHATCRPPSVRSFGGSAQRMEARGQDAA